MPTIQVKDTDLSYSLISFDKNGKERTDDAEGLMSQKIASILANEPITDVFIFSHGWLGDVPAAKDQYDRWVGVMAAQTQDIAQMQQIRRGFRPLLIGIHWPSLPFGEETLGTAGNNTSFAAAGTTASDPIEEMVEFYSEAIADTDAAKVALRTIVTSAAENISPSQLPDDVVAAYQELEREANLSQEGVAGAPGADREPFDPQQQYSSSKQVPVDFGAVNWSGLLAPLRTLSFWKMKDRARSIGESGGFQFLSKLQQQASNGVRFHLMGHSFGCIVVTAALCGKSGDRLPRPVNSVALVQGALSLWSYCDDIPYQLGSQGYFHRLVGEAKVVGPVLTTQSEHDTALSITYPLGAGVAGQVNMNPLEQGPKYGAVGTFGIRGDNLRLEFQNMLPIDKSYAFANGTIYNLESSDFINVRSGLGGAHNDIAKPEVAHAIWSAAMSG